jgi:hypothetical protein
MVLNTFKETLLQIRRTNPTSFIDKSQASDELLDRALKPLQYEYRAAQSTQPSENISKATANHLTLKRRIASDITRQTAIKSKGVIEIRYNPRIPARNADIR